MAKAADSGRVTVPLCRETRHSARVSPDNGGAEDRDIIVELKIEISLLLGSRSQRPSEPDLITRGNSHVQRDILQNSLHPKAVSGQQHYHYPRGPEAGVHPQNMVNPDGKGSTGPCYMDESQKHVV